MAKLPNYRKSCSWFLNKKVSEEGVVKLAGIVLVAMWDLNKNKHRINKKVEYQVEWQAG